MKIFYYCHVDLSGETGSIGSVRHVLEVINRLSERGHDVVLFAPNPVGSTDEIHTDEVRYFRNASGYLGFLLGVLHCLALMFRELLSEPPDVVYAREMLYTAHSLLPALVLGVPHVVEVNGYQPEEVRSDEDFLPLLYPLVIFFEGLNYWVSSAVIVVSPSVRTKIIDFYRLDEESVYCIRNGVNTDRCRPMASSRCRRELGYEPDAYYVGFIGYLFPWSGVEYIIEAAPRILEEYASTTFLIMGSGTWGEHLPRMAEREGVRDSFVFTGKVPWTEVPLYLNCLDVGVSPYPPREALGDSLKTYEYMACGLPVVVSDIPGLREVVLENRCGTVFPPGDSDALADAILQVLDAPDEYSSMSQRARETAVERFDWSHSVDRTEGLLKVVERSDYNEFPGPSNRSRKE